MTAVNSIRLVIIDDHPLFREGVAHTLATEPDLEIAGQGASTEEAIELVRRHTPDVLLLDIDIPGGGLTVIRAALAVCPTARVVMLTASASEEHVVTALRSGVQGYVLKGVSARELARIIRDVHAGKGYVPPELAAQLIAEMVSPVAPNPPADPLDDLTDRERQILDLVAAGASNKEIAQELHLTEKTVKYYMTNIMQKLQVRNRVEAAVLARRGRSSSNVH